MKAAAAVMKGINLPLELDGAPALCGSGSPLSPGVRQFSNGTNGGTLLALAYGQAAHENFPTLGISPRANSSQGISEDGGGHLAGSLGSEGGPHNKSSLSSMSQERRREDVSRCIYGYSRSQVSHGWGLFRRTTPSLKLPRGLTTLHLVAPCPQYLERQLLFLLLPRHLVIQAITFPRAHHQPLVRTTKGRLPREDSLSLPTSRYLLSRTRWEALPRLITRQTADGKREGGG